MIAATYKQGMLEMIGRWVAREMCALKQSGMTSQEAAAHIRNQIASGYNYFKYGVDRWKEVIDYLNKYYPQ